MAYTDVTVKKVASKGTVVNCGPARKLYLDGFAGMRMTGSLKELPVLTAPGTGTVFIEME